MSYHKDIIRRLSDSDNWPDFDNSNILNDLNEIADNSFSKNTIEGYLASLLIYHQITEELVKVIIDSSVFYVQLSVFPQEFNAKVLKGKMFGQIIDELKYAVTDKKTKLLIEQAQLLNKLRIDMVHKLTIHTTIEEIENKAKKVKSIFDRIFELFETIYDNYRVTYSDYKKNLEEFEEFFEDDIT